MLCSKINAMAIKKKFKGLVVDCGLIPSKKLEDKGLTKEEEEIIESIPRPPNSFGV